MKEESALTQQDDSKICIYSKRHIYQSLFQNPEHLNFSFFIFQGSFGVQLTGNTLILKSKMNQETSM